MARMMFDNLNAIVANTLTDSIKMIDIDQLHESEDNFFEINRVEEFADTILGQGGVKDNLIVKPLESGGYEIISGHRRTAAVRYLIEQGKNISHFLPCLVQNYSDDDDKKLDIILMNISARQISDAEMYKSYKIVDEILKHKKSAGEKFGRVREKLAECLGVSPAQVGKMQNIEKNAVCEVKQAVANGDISISTANEIAKLDAESQEELLESENNLSEIKPKDLKVKDKKKTVNEVEQAVDYISDVSAPTTVTAGEIVKLDEEIQEELLEDDFELSDLNEIETEDFAKKKVDTNINFQDFVKQNSVKLDEIFRTYIDITDNFEEKELLKSFIELIEKM